MSGALVGVFTGRQRQCDGHTFQIPNSYVCQNPFQVGLYVILKLLVKYKGVKTIAKLRFSCGKTVTIV